jgi:hypothetical protein
MTDILTLKVRRARLQERIRDLDRERDAIYHDKDFVAAELERVRREILTHELAEEAKQASLKLTII